MSNNIIDFIKKQGNIFDTSKYFGGIDKLRELAKSNNELKTFLEDNSKGWFSFKANGKNYKFDFYTLDYFMEDENDDAVHLTLYVDLIINYPNLNDEELLTIGKWVAEYTEDGSLHTVSEPKNLIDEESYAFYMVQVDKINGKDVPWIPSKLLDDTELVVPDKTVEDLIEKSKNGGIIQESVIRIKELINVDIK